MNLQEAKSDDCGNQWPRSVSYCLTLETNDVRYMVRSMQWEVGHKAAKSLTKSKVKAKQVGWGQFVAKVAKVAGAQYSWPAVMLLMNSISNKTRMYRRSGQLPKKCSSCGGSEKLSRIVIE